MIRRILLTVAIEIVVIALVVWGLRLVLHAQIPAPEGAMGHDAPTVQLSCRIERAPRASAEFYRLICGGPESFVVSADGHSMLARWLSGRVGQRQPITFGEVEP